MAAGEDGKQGVLDHLFLAEDHLGHFLADRGDVGEGLFSLLDDRLFIQCDIRIWHHAHGLLQLVWPGPANRTDT